MAAESHPTAVSLGTQLVLGLAGVSVAVFVLWLASLLARGLISLSRRATAPRPAKAAPARQQAQQQPQQQPKQPGARQPSIKELVKQSKAASKHASTKEDVMAHHALFVTTLKGHHDAVTGLAWSSDAQLLATACDDSQLRVFDLAGLAPRREPKFRFVETKHPPLGVGFANDGQSLVAAVRGFPDVGLVCYAPHKKGAVLTWAPAWDKAAVLGREPLLDLAVVPAPQSAALGAQGGGIAVLLSEKKQAAVLSLASGLLLAEVEPNSFTNHGLAVSADGRFIAVASFTSDVKVWEVQWGRDGYKGTAKVMDLKGHSSQVMSVAFSPDGRRAVTASKDGTMQIWRTDVRYQLQEDPKVLLKQALPLPPGQCFERMAWGPDGTIAAALGGHIHFIDAASGKVLEVLHAHESRVLAMQWAPRRLAIDGPVSPPVAVLASCSGDRRARVWRSPQPPAE